MREIGLLFAVAAGGSLGALARFLIAELVRVATHWPPYVSTFLANLLGCFAIGVVFQILEHGDHPAWVRAILVTGILGAFTTFSTFSLDAMHLIEDRRFGELAVYLVASVLSGLLAVKAGMFVVGLR